MQPFKNDLWDAWVEATILDDITDPAPMLDDTGPELAMTGAYDDYRLDGAVVTTSTSSTCSTNRRQIKRRLDRSGLVETLIADRFQRACWIESAYLARRRDQRASVESVSQDE